MADEHEGRADQEAIGQRVRELRELRGLPQQHVAMVMTLTKGYRWHQTVVAKVERGERSLKLSEAVALADILGVPVGELTEQRGTYVERGLAIAELRALVQHIEARVAELEG